VIFPGSLAAWITVCERDGRCVELDIRCMEKDFIVMEVCKMAKSINFVVVLQIIKIIYIISPKRSTSH